MMHPAATRSNRSSLQATISPVPPASPLLNAHPQQQILYNPIANPMVHFQPCATGLHPPCVYPGVQHNSAIISPAPAHIQGKNTRWTSKNKILRSQHQQQIQQQLSFNPKPVILYDQSLNNVAGSQPAASFLVASSTFTHGSFPNDRFSPSGVGIIPQPYFKPQDVQTFCLPNNQQQQQDQAVHGSYYNIAAANPCNLQAINTNPGFQISNLGSYPGLTSHQIPVPVPIGPTNQIFNTSPVNLALNTHQREKSSAIDTSSLQYMKSRMPAVSTSHEIPSNRSEDYTEWPVSKATSSTHTLLEVQSTTGHITTETVEPLFEKTTSGIIKSQDEHYSDESSTSFDFTIEAEKMVSALCTSSNDLEKEETQKNNKKISEPLFSGAGDTASNKNDWFSDFCADYGNGKSIGVQTDNSQKDSSQYPELIRKVAYWGCTEAEILLNNVQIQKSDSKSAWLKQLSTATKTAMTKSSTCFPIFAGDRVFIADLINSLLRITNGWLILDNYLNKQHYPSLSEKFDQELLQCFYAWEENTYEVLNQIIKTFKKLGGNSEVSKQEENSNDFTVTSFPGDISLYTNYDLFIPSAMGNTILSQEASAKISRQEVSRFPNTQILTESIRSTQSYNSEEKQQQQSCSKEAKLRSKWTVTENLTPITDNPKSVPNIFLGLEETTQGFNNRFRPRGNAGSSTQSLNAEFFHLKSKILENNQDASRQWRFKEKREELLENTKLLPDNEILLKSEILNQSNCEVPYPQKYFPGMDTSYQKPNPVSLESIYFTSTADTAAACMKHNYTIYYLPYTTMTDYSVKCYKNFEQTCESRGGSVDPLYIGKSSMKQVDIAPIPRNKMTLLSQIEPCTSEKSSEEMAANLSAWFASMRSPDVADFMTIPNIIESKPVETIMPRLPPRQELSKNVTELARQLQMDSNRQLQSLQNMQSIQSAPWTALNLLNNCTQVQRTEDYDSSEDVRVYMKPGSYNVPKKKHQRKSNRRMENASRNQLSNSHRNHFINKEKGFSGPTSSTPVSRSASSLCTNVNNSNVTTTAIKLPYSATPIVPPPVFSLENSPRILTRSSTSGTGVKNDQDVAWKAACASAEILLDALNVKEPIDSIMEENDPRGNLEVDPDIAKEESSREIVENSMEGQKKSHEKLSEALGRSNDCDGATSYEASGDDSESPYQLTPNMSLANISQSPDNRNSLGKTTVKTDSWLIRTLNSVSIISKQKRRKKSKGRSTSESSNSSAMEEDDSQTHCPCSLSASVSSTKPTTTESKIFEDAKCSRDVLRVPSLKNDQSLTEEIDRLAGKATYSETVRRSLPMGASHNGKKESCKKSKMNNTTPAACSSIIPIPGRKCQRKDPERSYYLLQKSRKSYTKKSTKSSEAILCQSEEGLCSSKIRVSRSEPVKSSSISMPYTATKSTVIIKPNGKKKDYNTGNYSESFDGKWAGKSGDRGWSVWYSSKRKQTLSPLALSKLEMIHQTVWKMEEAEVFKHPAGNFVIDKGFGGENALEQYCKVVKSPVFLETVGYKLKNRVYHKVEHVIRDFRRIIYNSKMYHKDDQDRVKVIEALSKKLEDLFEEHFSTWDFNNVSGSPRDESPISHQFKSNEQKLLAGRYGNTKKNPSTSVVTDDTLCN